jgi:hypothetical protein
MVVQSVMLELLGFRLIVEWARFALLILLLGLLVGGFL